MITASPKKSAAPKMPTTRIQAGPAAEAAAHQGDERQDPALALVVGAQHEGDIFDRDDDRQRPEDQRQHAEHLLGRGRRAAGRGMQRLAQRIDRAGADVAIDDAERAEHQQRQLVFGRRAYAGFGCGRRHVREAASVISGNSHSKPLQANWPRPVVPLQCEEQPDPLPMLRQPKSPCRRRNGLLPATARPWPKQTLR